MKSKGKSVSVERKQVDCFHWKAREKCTREDVCSFRHNSRKRGASTRSSRSPRSNDKKCWEISFGRQAAQRDPASCERLQKLCKDYLDENGTNPSCDSRHPPAPQNRKSQKNRLHICREMFSPSKGEGQTARKAKKGGGKVSCGLCSERQALVVCISRCGAAEVQLVRRVNLQEIGTENHRSE